MLYGVGNAGGLFTIDTATAAATPAGTLSVALAGGSFGVDFNPAADRLRVVSDTTQNLRHQVGGATTTDAALSGAGVTGAAYTNNDLNPSTATTLFDINTTTDQLVIQAPPNNGNLNVVGSLTVDAVGNVGFDIFSALDDASISTNNFGYATLTVAGVSGLYSISLLTGKATFVGSFAAANQVIGIALALA